MPNVIGGKNYKKTKNNNVRRKSRNPDLPVDTTTGIDHYAIVLRRSGDNRLIAKLDNGKEIIAVIPGKFWKKVWFKNGDYIQIRDAGNDSYDIIQKIVNANEQIKAQIALGKQSNTTDDYFRPDLKEDDEDELNLNYDNKLSDKSLNSLSEDDDDEIKSNTNKKKITEPIKNENVNININVDKLKRRQREKERDLSRRVEKDYDIRPISLISKSETDSESDSDSDS